jgi:hypothetical protein
MWATAADREETICAQLPALFVIQLRRGVVSGTRLPPCPVVATRTDHCCRARIPKISVADVTAELARVETCMCAVLQLVDTQAAERTKGSMRIAGVPRKPNVWVVVFRGQHLLLLSVDFQMLARCKRPQCQSVFRVVVAGRYLRESIQLTHSQGKNIF